VFFGSRAASAQCRRSQPRYDPHSAVESRPSVNPGAHVTYKAYNAPQASKRRRSLIRRPPESDVCSPWRITHSAGTYRSHPRNSIHAYEMAYARSWGAAKPGIDAAAQMGPQGGRNLSCLRVL
jgi:hypothetical protein